MSGRPPELAKIIGLDQRQWVAWGGLQKAALRFASAFLADGFRTGPAKDAFFESAMAFARSFVPPEKPKRRRRG